MAPKDTLRLGQKLTIWSNESPNNSLVNNRPANPTLADRAPSGVMTQRINYKVRNGDSLWQIASKFNTSVSQLKSWNSKVKNRKYLQPGQTLTLYVDITQG
jgi:membrane-bound lytic murein transglycosylase D